MDAEKTSENEGLPAPLPRCPACALHLPLCLCDEVEARPTRTAVRLIVHDRELSKSSNSARLLPLLLARARIELLGLEADGLRIGHVAGDHALAQHRGAHAGYGGIDQAVHHSAPDQVRRLMTVWLICVAVSMALALAWK